MQLPIYIYAILTGAVTGLILWRRTDPLYLKLFPFFLLGSAICEFIGWYMEHYLGKPNAPLYNYLSTYEFTVYLLILGQVVVNKKAKTFILWVAGSYLVFGLLNIHLIQGVNTFNTFSYCTGCLLTIMACMYYFIELFQLPKLINLAKEPAFWICSGLLFFCALSFPLLGLANYIVNISSLVVKYFKYILYSINALLYILFTVAFLCRIRLRKPVLKTNR